jgi:hypothetical protein
MPVPQVNQEMQEHPDNPEALVNLARKDHLAHQDSPETMERQANPVNLDRLEAPERREFAQNIAQSMGAFSSRTALDDVKQQQKHRRQIDDGFGGDADPIFGRRLYWPFAMDSALLPLLANIFPIPPFPLNKRLPFLFKY